jgi:hypothetical protein
MSQPLDPTGPPDPRPLDLTSHAEPDLVAEPAVIDLDVIPPAPPSPPHRRRPALLGAALVAFVVLLAGGAYAGAHTWYGWGSVEPEAVVPAEVTAFARIDLGPGFQQRLKLAPLIRKFERPGVKDPLAALKHEVVSQTHAGLDYDRDVAPWFGDRAGVATWRDAAGKHVALVALASRDDGKARAALARVRATNVFGYAVRDGYALLAFAEQNAQSDAEAALASARKHPLAREPGFVAAVGRLPGAHLAVGYLNLAGLGPTLPADGTGAAPMPDLGSLTGVVASGAETASDGILVHLTAPAGNAAATTPGDIRSTVDALPADAIVAGALHRLGSSGAAADQLVAGLAPMFGFGLLGPPTPSDLQMVPPGPGDLTVPPDVNGVPVPIGPDGDPFADPTIDPGVVRAMQARMEAARSVVEAILTAKMVSFAVTGLASGDSRPDVVGSAQAGDEAAARKLSTALKSLLAGPAATDVQVDQQGDTVHVRVGQPGGGRLADNPLYRKAMAGALDHPMTVLYLDLTRISTDGTRPADPIQAAALTLAREGGYTTGLVHLVIP